MHRLDIETLVTPALLKRFHAEGEFESGDGRFFAVMQQSNGDLLTHAVGPDAGPDAMLFASDTLSFLNKHLHHDGAWCIVFTHYRAPTPPMMHGAFDRFVILWMDHDGDVQFPVERDHAIPEAFGYGNHSWAMQCETAWNLWHHAMVTVLEPKADAQYKRAKGQRAPTVH